MYFLWQLSQGEMQVQEPDLDYFPDPQQGVVYHKPGFSLSYVEEYELPEWVAYALTVDMMNKPKHDRDQDFNPDPAITTGSGHYRDYKSSGYRRGHLVPSADMAWNKEAMDATFLLSNVAPMREQFNDGIWLELEHNVRDWSRRYKEIKVVTGPLFKETTTTIGDNEILVPKYFYKAVFTFHDTVPMVIAFLFDQELAYYGPLEQYIVSLDSLEKATGLELFENLYGDWDSEIMLEKKQQKDKDTWPINKRWYDQRLERGDKRE
jgi:endonuclease G